MNALIPALAPITYVAAIRDMIQSLYGEKVRHDEPELLKFFGLIGAFNEAGPIQIAGIEGHGGALPQYDALSSRLSLKIAKRITNTLHKLVFQRPLIRGPFGINTRALHYNDLAWTLEQIAVAGGAQEGRKVIFKLFEAQNRPEEYVASLKIIQDLKRRGFDVACEVSMVISDKPGLNADHYKRVAASLLSKELFDRHRIDPSVVAGFSLKDMIGGVKSSANANGSTINARNLATIGMETIQNFADQYAADGRHLAPVYFGWHTHDIGNALDCLTEAGQVFAAHRERMPAINEFQQDVTAQDYGFTDLALLTDRFAKLGISLGMSDAQRGIWAEMTGHLEAFKERFAHVRIDTKKWPKALLEYGQLASGGLPYVEKHGITQFQKHVARMLGDVTPENMERAGEILRGVFVSINGMIDNDMGNAHSVTPAMKFINDLTIDVMSRYLHTPEFAALIRSETDFTKPITDAAFQASARAQYHHFSSTENVKQALAYFCTPMPTPVSDEHLGLLRSKLFDTYFPVNDAGFAGLEPNSSAHKLRAEITAAGGNYADVRATLAGQLLDKDAARRTLMVAGVREKTAEEFVARNIGVNSRPINDGVRPVLLTKIVDAVHSFLEKTGGYSARRRGFEPGENPEVHMQFMAMLLRPRKGLALAEAVTTLADALFRKRKGWDGMAMSNGHANGNGNGDAHHQTQIPERPGLRGKVSPVVASAAVTGGADDQPAVKLG